MPYVLAFALTMILAAFTLPRTSGELPAKLISVARADTPDLSLSSFIYFWFFLAFVSGSYIWGNVSPPSVHLPTGHS
jgi:hypothetical protein